MPVSRWLDKMRLAFSTLRFNFPMAGVLESKRLCPLFSGTVGRGSQ